MDRTTLARMIDHTLLRPDATPAEVAALCAEAGELGVAAVCVAPARLPLVEPAALPPGIGVATVIGFPSGAHRLEVKLVEAEQAVVSGATELDAVLDRGLVRAGAWRALEREVTALRSTAPSPVVLKVIVESAALSDEELLACCRAAEDGGADFVKTSTGFDPAGGATTHAVGLIAAAVGGRLGVKASGGIRDAQRALELVDAGATRLGCSATRAILEGLA